MRQARAIIALVGALGIPVLVLVVRASPVATFGGMDLRLLVAEVAAAAALLALSLLRPAQATSTLLAVVAALWLMPEAAGGTDVPEGLRTVADAVPSVLVLLLLTALVLGSRPVSTTARVGLLVAALCCLLAVIARVFLVDPYLQVDCWRICGHNPLLIAEDRAGQQLHTLALLGLVAAVLCVGVHSLRSRRAAVSAAADLLGWVLVALMAVSLLVQPGAATSQLRNDAAMVLFVAVQAAAAAWLLTSARDAWLRWRLERRLAEVVELLGGGDGSDPVGGRLGRAVADTDLRVVFWAPSRGCHVDAAGRPVPDDDPGPGRRVTTVTQHGRPVASVVHSGAIDGQRLDRALGPALRLALENVQLRASSLAELDELRRSRARVVERGETERRRLERNLHDGAQQRAVSLALLVRLLPGDDEAQVTTRERAGALAGRLIDELRGIARGIHPAVLADAGLLGAIEDLAERSEDLPVVLGEFPENRYPPAVESTAYLVVQAAITDARACASLATVTGLETQGALVVRVQDDGAGTVSRVRPLRDRVEALGGTLSVHEPDGERVVEVVLPCAS